MSVNLASTHLNADDRRRMEAITAALPTKSAKIRALAAAGYKRARIADFLNIRYQHVRNVLVSSAREERSPPVRVEAADDGREEASAEAMSYGRVPVDATGQIRLPQAVLDVLEIRPGGWIPWRLEDGELKLMNRAAALRFGQSLAADLAKRHPGVWSDQLIAERRAEAARDAAEQGDD
jgi:hypothetical protein